MRVRIGEERQQALTFSCTAAERTEMRQIIRICGYIDSVNS